MFEYRTTNNYINLIQNTPYVWVRLNLIFSSKMEIIILVYKNSNSVYSLSQLMLTVQVQDEWYRLL